MVGGLALLLLAGETYRPYVNARFGYLIEVPATWRALPEAPNGDGRRFVSRDGGTKLTVWGRYDIDDAGPKAFLRAELREATATLRGKGIRPTYRVVRPTWFVLSWREGATVVYQKETFSPIGEATFVLRYPAAQSKRLGPVVARIARSFTPPKR